VKEEYNSLINSTQAVTPVSVDQLDPNNVEFVPGKLVCVVKAGPNGGKRKCRGVICGNMMEEDPSPIGVYASGADGTLIRTVLRHSVLKGCWLPEFHPPNKGPLWWFPLECWLKRVYVRHQRGG